MPLRLPPTISILARRVPQTSCPSCRHCIRPALCHRFPPLPAHRLYSFQTQTIAAPDTPPDPDSTSQSEIERFENLKSYMQLDEPNARDLSNTGNFQDLKTKVGDYKIRGWAKDTRGNSVKVKGELGRRCLQIRYRNKGLMRTEGETEVEGGNSAVPYKPMAPPKPKEVDRGANAAPYNPLAPNDTLIAFNRIYTSMWLRDHCQCTSCVHPDTKQRLLDTFAIPPDIEPNDMTIEKTGLRIQWDADLHKSFYTWEWLWEHPFLTGVRYAPLEETRLFLRDIPQDTDVTVSYEEVMASDRGVASWTSKIHRFGYCYVDGCPITPEATEQLLKRIAFIRDTHYGAFWDFTSDLTLKDTAYTNLPLSAHTDNTYFTDPAGLQMFHLLSHESGTGGASLLVDGFLAANVLRNEALDAYNILSRVKLPWHASGNEGLSIRPSMSFPVLEHWQDHSKNHPKLVRVRWNNDDRGTMDNWGSVDESRLWYDAAREWSNILKRKELEIWEQLKPGRPIIFDNWRILHGRSAFTGKRRMCGGYINRDDFMSRYRMTNFGREAVLSAV